MADKKITELVEDTTPTLDDLIVTVNNPEGTPVNKKVTLANVKIAMSPTGYALSVGSGEISVGGLSPADGLTYYFGCFSHTNPGTTAAETQLYIPKAGTIKVAWCRIWATGTAGSNENISLYIRLNNTTDTLIATVGNTDAQKIFSNTDLNTSVAQGDKIEMKLVCPTWATNPTGIFINGVIYIE